MEAIRAVFPELPEDRLALLAALQPLYLEWNAKINVISRKDTDDFCLHHVMHSLSLLRVVRFVPGSRVLDVGTGGGFPGIPLAVCCPQVRFVLCDSIGKKLKVAEDVVRRLGLANVELFHGRAETLPRHAFQYAVSRAVATLQQLLRWTDDKMAGTSPADAGGLYCLKGGDLTAELAGVPATRMVRVSVLSDFLPDPYFLEKKVVYVASRR
ncbi:MAG: 16S rRNA (guanine(527)-N(7))-methyltransferase RsmG [Bacteroidales bacterium]|nr:16S rRNA (guanine(527)-N(7))-methyltransferase RsmG [Bacteroidales bacterium]MBQ7214301.1 16S rRNA (guanine(527)-N(7))-methyltransferase RsmG [Bacteroidales bacterium]